MQVLKAKVEWRLKFGNTPYLELLVDKIPSVKDMRYAQKKNCYYAEHEGYVSFFHWNGKECCGFGGHHFKLTAIDGSPLVLKGPGASRPGVMNSMGFGPCVNVSLTSEEHVFNRGFTFMCGAITLQLAEEALSHLLPEIELCKEVSSFDGEVNYIPTLKGMKPQEAKQYLRNAKRKKEVANV